MSKLSSNPINLNTTLLESTHDAILAIDTSFHLNLSNTQFNSKFVKDLTSKHIEDIFDDQEVISAFKDCIKTSESRKVQEHSIFYKNRTHYYEIVVSPILRNNECIGAMGVFKNITEAKLTEQMRVDFVANVSHEIRTPLTSIKGFAQVLDSNDKFISPEAKHYLEKIITNTERLHALFSDLLNLSVIESRHRLLKKEVNLKFMLESVKAMLLQNYADKNMNISYDLSVEFVRVDPKLFEQALINLIENACKYSGNDANIKISNFIDNNESVIITISDDGPGISKEHLGRIFERFYQVDSSRNKKHDSTGTGLGLSIVKHIIAKHKGVIWAESEPNQGTIFFIKLPINPNKIDHHD